MKRTGKVSTYSELVQLVLDETGWTGYRLAKEAGLTAVAVGDLLAGKRQPKTETLRLILKAAGKPWGWLDDVFDPNGTTAPPVPEQKKGKQPRKAS
jgi:transcriptional regulator with XRE-family HTH domain